MKPEEVIRAIDLIREIDINTPITQVDIANAEWGKEMAIEALEKQIQKKPKISDGIAYERYEYCPSCGMSVTDNYCGNCGQAIDWGNEE